MSKKIELERFKDALRLAADKTSSIDLTDYDAWLGYNNFIDFAWRALDGRTKRNEKINLRKKPEKHQCPTLPLYKKSIKLFGKQFYTLEEQPHE